MDASREAALHLASRLLEKHEGFRSKPYRDTVGHLTVGFGRNLDVVGLSVSEARVLLFNDVLDADDHLASYSWYSRLSPQRQAALIDMCVNLGREGFDRFSLMIHYLERGDFVGAAFQVVNSRAGQELRVRYRELADIIEKGSEL